MSYEVISKDEQMLETEVSAVEMMAMGVAINNQDDYERASDFLKEIKRASKKVEEFWEPVRKSAYDTYQSVLAKKKEMTKPLERAEKTVKGAMKTYVIEEEKKRKAEEERLRALAEAEAEKKRREAEWAAIEGNEAGVEMALAEAEVLSNSAAVIKVDAPQKVDGISKVKTYEVVIVDESQVPVSVAGVVIRPVDTSAIMKLAKASDGTIKVPGVEIKETVSIRVRA